MSAARHTAAAAASLVTIATLAIVGSAGGAPSAKNGWKRDRVAPSAPTNVRVTAASASAVTLAWDASRDNVAVTGYHLFGEIPRARVNGTTYTIDNLTCGASFAVWIVAVDRAGNRSLAAQAIVSTAACADTTSPTAPNGFYQEATSDDAVVLAWEPSQDNVGVVAYGVYRAGLPLTSASTPKVTLTGLACGETYEIAVDAVDGAGNRSPRSPYWVQPAGCSPLDSPRLPDGPAPWVDTQPPSAPGSLAVSGVTQTGVTLTWDASTDDVGVAGYGVDRDGKLVSTVSRPGSTLTGLTCGTTYAFAVDAYDDAGNRSAKAFLSASTSACDQPTPPPPPADTTPPTQPGSLAVSAATQTSVSLTWLASSDGVGVAGYGVYRDGTLVSTVARPGATLADLRCGAAYTVAVDAYDAAGNRSAKTTMVATTMPCLDTQPPTVPAGIQAQSRTASSIALSWFASADNVGVAGYGLYRGGALVGETAQTTAVFSGLTCNTNYTLAVDAYDASGNRSAKATVMVATTACLDTTPPSAPSGLAASNVTQTGLTLQWTASTDAVGVLGYDVYLNSVKTASVTSTSSVQSGLACGTAYTFGVQAYDAAGNRSQIAALAVATSACATASPAPVPSAGTVLFDGGFDSGTTSEWSYVHRYTTERYQAVSSDAGVTPRRGSHMARIETRYNEPTSWTTGANASIAQRDSIAGAQLGADVYTGFSVYLPNGFQYVPNQYMNNIVEWHAQSGMDQAPIHFFLDGYKGGAFSLDLHTDPTGYNPKPVWGGLKFGPLVTGRWVDFVFRVKWATDSSGLLEGWMDGEKKFSWSGPTWGSAVRYVYPMLGYYRANYSATAVFYADAFRVGTSYASVAP